MHALTGSPRIRMAAWCAGAAALALYTLTTCPTVHWGDSGELIVAGVTLGIAHPPGHPLYSIIAHAFAWLPFGEAAWRVNWMSAVFGGAAVALTVAFAANTVRRLGGGPHRALACGVFAGALFATTATLWSGSTVAETTTLHAAFMAALFALVWSIAWVRPAGPALTQALGAAAALYGFSATNHVAGILFLPAFAVLLVGRCGRDVLRPRNVAVMFACVGAGLLLYAYLPLRSMQEPVLDWGNPETFPNFWWVVTAKQFQATMAQPIGLAKGAASLADRGVLIASEFTPLGTLLAIVGLYALARRAPWFAAFILLAVMPLVALGLSSAFILAYFVPGALLLSVAAAIGAHTVLDRFPRVPRAAVALVAAGVVAWSALSHYEESAAQEARGAELYARALLEPLPPNAVLFTTNMNMLFTTWAVQATQGVRPDVAVIDWQWTAGDSPLTRELARDYPDLTFLSMPDLEPYRARLGVGTLTRDDAFAAVVDRNWGRRPLYLCVPGAPTRLADRLVPRGGSFEILSEPNAAATTDAVEATRAYWEAWAARLATDTALDDRYLEETLAYDLNNQGLWFERRARTAMARWEYSTAIRLAPHQPRPYLNRGRLVGATGNWFAALADYQTAAALQPRDPEILLYVGMAEESLERPDRAYDAYTEALLWDPTYAPACRRAGMLMFRAGDLDRARSLLSRALAAAPDDAVAARALVRVALAAGDNAGAVPALQRARAADPESVQLLLLVAEYAARTGQAGAAADALAAAFRRDPETAARVTAHAAWSEGLLPDGAPVEG